MNNYIEIDKVVQHPKFKGNLLSLENDIALVKLKTPIAFSQNVQPACLGVNKMSVYNGALSIAGWGSNKPIDLDLETQKFSNYQSSNSLLEGDVYDVTKSHESCSKQDDKNDRLICVDHSSGRQDSACKGILIFILFFKRSTNFIICQSFSFF